MDRIQYDEAGYGDARFHEYFIMHTSRSLLYPVIISLDVATTVDGPGGKILIDEYVEIAIRFRQMVERVTVSRLEGGIVATGIVPYPLGIPLLFSNERAGDQSIPILAYLKGLQDLISGSPGISMTFTK